MKRADRLRAIEARIRRGDLDGAIGEYRVVLEDQPDDWASVIALGDLQVQKGAVEEGALQLSRAADHFLEEGFYAKAAALYRRIVKLVEDDHALLSLIDIAARQGQLTEARQHLVVLERQRRERGDTAGADECLASLEAIVDVQTRPDAAPQDEPIGSGMAAAAVFADAVEIPDLPDTAVTVLDGAPEAVDEVPRGPVEPEPPAQGAPPAARSGSGRKTRKAARAKRSAASGATRSLQDVFDGFRRAALQEAAVDEAQRRFDRAQEYLRDGDETAAIPELAAASGAPMLRFVSCAQLGRLHAARGELADAAEWLERATQSPPVSPDEGLAVLYELGDTLERQGDSTRALVIFMELDAQRARYRDVRARIEALSRAFDREGGQA